MSAQSVEDRHRQEKHQEMSGKAQRIMYNLHLEGSVKELRMLRAYATNMLDYMADGGRNLPTSEGRADDS